MCYEEHCRLADFLPCYEQEAGALWDQRLKQVLLSNGVAVLQINPITDDEWDAFPAQWDGYRDASSGKTVGGVDRPFLQTLFKQIVAGDLGPLDPSRVVLGV